VRVEAAYIVSNIIFSGTPDTVIEIMQPPLLYVFVRKLMDIKSDVVLVLLDAIEQMLQKDVDKNDGQFILARRFDEVGGLELIEELQFSEKRRVYQSAVRILEKYFNVEEEI
jgi:hypothetical protein